MWVGWQDEKKILRCSLRSDCKEVHPEVNWTFCQMAQHFKITSKGNLPIRQVVTTKSSEPLMYLLMDHLVIGSTRNRKSRRFFDALWEMTAKNLTLKWTEPFAQSYNVQNGSANYSQAKFADSASAEHKIWWSTGGPSWPLATEATGLRHLRR